VAAYFAIGGIVGALTMRVTERINAYFFAGLSIALANCFVVGVFNLPERLLADGTGFTSLLGYAVLNGLGAAMTALAAIFLLTFAFNLTTSVKLAELSQPNQPLLQRLLREAPGTYQHSLQVANLCEQAASAIGADAELVRIAALYHDIGKMLNPAFFVENQVDGVNPHDVLADPYRSADIIINHVVDGDRLARQYRLPARIRDFILEHHGTTRVGYFYNQAVRELDDPDGVDEDQFRYPGPRPRSRETAILMLADASESTVRARKPGSRAEVAEIIGGLIEQRIAEKQLDHSGLTLRDLDAIHQILVELLQSVFHPRINYPAAVSRRTLGLDLGEAAETVRPADLPARPVPAKDGTAELPRAGTSTPAGDGPRDDGRGEQRGVNGFRSPIDDDETPVSQVPPLRRTSLVPAVTPPAEPETNVPPIA
jgi:putative nucleotidyltransferase with HDIG domain